MPRNNWEHNTNTLESASTIVETKHAIQELVREQINELLGDLLHFVNSCFRDILGLAHLDRLKKLATTKNSALQPRGQQRQPTRARSGRCEHGSAYKPPLYGSS